MLNDEKGRSFLMLSEFDSGENAFNTIEKFFMMLIRQLDELNVFHQNMMYKLTLDEKTRK